jgi:uridine kinase
MIQKTNDNIKDILLQQFKKYPLMEVCDAVKLLFQSEFGGGHAVSDEYFCMKRIEDEGSNLSIEQLSEPYFEEIGGGYSRINLSSLKVIPVEVLGKMFIVSSENNLGTADEFEKKLNLLRNLCEEGKTAFSADTLNKYLENYRKTGYHPVSHSKTYTENYHPAYRVVRNEYCRYLDVFIRISRIYKDGYEVTVAIDGQSASGKTTLAKLISTVFDCNIFHTDDYFLPLELKTKDRLGEIGGNMDYRRFKNEICENLNSGKPFVYQIYNCQTARLDKRIAVAPKRLNIIEGAYSMHPTLQKYYELKIYLGIEPVYQAERILERNGEEMFRRFATEWIPKENEYIEKMNIMFKCDLAYGINKHGAELI